MSLQIQRLAVGALLAMCLGSAFAIVISTHHCRDLYARLQQLDARRWFLDEEYSRLLLEQSTWASHQRIATAAEENLHMQVPPLSRTRLVQR